MDKMTHTDTPIFALIFTGNHKEKLCKWQYAFVVAYEQPFDLTVCLVKTTILNNREHRKEYRRLEKEVSRITKAEPTCCFYFKNGCDVQSVWDMLNLKN